MGRHVCGQRKTLAVRQNMNRYAKNRSHSGYFNRGYVFAMPLFL